MLFIIICNNCKKVDSISGDSKTFQASDQGNYTHLKGNFYTDLSGKLFEKRSYAIAGDGETWDAQIFFDSTVSKTIGDSTIENTLSETIDIKTFTEIGKGTLFSKDKNKVYYSYVDTGGGSRVIINNADPKTFIEFSNSDYAKDSKNLYYQSRKIEHINIKNYKILYSFTDGQSYIEYLKDDKNVFYKDEIVKGAHAKTFKIVNGKKWLAEDKNYKYECCGQKLD